MLITNLALPFLHSYKSLTEENMWCHWVKVFKGSMINLSSMAKTNALVHGQVTWTIARQKPEIKTNKFLYLFSFLFCFFIFQKCPISMHFNSINIISTFFWSASQACNPKQEKGKKKINAYSTNILSERVNSQACYRISWKLLK